MGVGVGLGAGGEVREESLRVGVGVGVGAGGEVETKGAFIYMAWIET